MNRILQIILGLIFLQHVVALLMTLTYLPARFFNVSKEMSKETSYPKGQMKFKSNMSLGPLRLSRSMEYDTVAQKGEDNLYAGLPHLTTMMSVNGMPYIITAGGEAVPARYSNSKKGSVLEVPISKSRYRLILNLSLVLILIYLLILLYMMIELFRFSKQAGRQDFFNSANQRRLRIFGTFMLLSAVFSYAADTSGAWLLQQLTGTGGYKYDSQTGDSGTFPIALVAGLFMFIMANALGKGQHLQKEQDLTI